MSSSVSPLLLGLFAASLLLTFIWAVSATYRRVERFRSHRRGRAEGMTTSETWIDRPRARTEKPEKPEKRSSPRVEVPDAGAPKVVVGPEHTSQQASEPKQTAVERRRVRLDTLAAIQEAERKADELLLDAERQCADLLRKAEAEAHRKAGQITEDARQRAAEQLEEAELEARAIVADTARERALRLTEVERERMRLEVARSKLAMPTPLEAVGQQAEELLIAARHRGEELLRESEAEAERKASEIADVARRQAEAVVQRAELEATRIVAAADQERVQLVQALARERSVQENTRTKLSAFLADMLAEVEAAAPDTQEVQANVRDLDEVRAVRKAAADS